MDVQLQVLLDIIKTQTQKEGATCNPPGICGPERLACNLYPVINMNSIPELQEIKRLHLLVYLLILLLLQKPLTYGLRKVAPAGKCFPCKHEDLSSVPRRIFLGGSKLTHTSNPSTMGVKTEGFLLSLAQKGTMGLKHCSSKCSCLQLKSQK